MIPIILLRSNVIWIGTEETKNLFQPSPLFVYGSKLAIADPYKNNSYIRICEAK